MEECKLMENGKEVLSGSYGECLKLLEQKAQQDKEKMEYSICEIKQGLDYYSRVEVKNGDWYFLRINDNED